MQRSQRVSISLHLHETANEWQRRRRKDCLIPKKKCRNSMQTNQWVIHRVSSLLMFERPSKDVCHDTLVTAAANSESWHFRLRIRDAQRGKSQSYLLHYTWGRSVWTRSVQFDKEWLRGLFIWQESWRESKVFSRLTLLDNKNKKIRCDQEAMRR